MRHPSASALAVALAAALPARAEEMVRIAVETGVPRVALSGRGLRATPLREAAAPRPLGDRAEAALADDDVVVAGQPLEAAGATFAADGPIRVGSLALRGEVEVRRGEGGLDVIHLLPLEEYVAAVAAAEMPASFPPEALKAQAVATRTFALFKKLEALGEGRSWHLGATVLHQVYRGSGADPRALEAARATAGQVLVRDHAPIAAYFHSACGGRTESGAEALGRDEPYLASVTCGRCGASPRSRWRLRLSAAEAGHVAGLRGPATRVQVVARTAAGRASRVAFEGPGGHAALGAADLRQRLGFERLPSLAFTVRQERGGFVIDGRGAGHGAGLCQWGAAGFARAGLGYGRILAHYYPGTEIARMY
jgi:stage II sporulation protein D